MGKETFAGGGSGCLSEPIGGAEMDACHWAASPYDEVFVCEGKDSE